GEAIVPLDIPDGWNAPARYRSPAYLLECDISGMTNCVYDAVTVMFQLGATQEERQAAIEVVNGVLEGGSPAISTYFIRIQGDSAFTGLRSALTKLRALPQVHLAAPYGDLPLDFAHSRRTTDIDDTPPDSIPLSIYADSNIVANPPGGIGAYAKDVIMVWFKHSSPVEERAAAVRSMGGSVIGGDGESMYLIRVAPDGSVAPSIPAARRLARLPPIRTSIPVFFFDLNSQRPEDSSGGGGAKRKRSSGTDTTLRGTLPRP
ncbi:MAG TPA: hypothetical protein VFH27_16010, partial [Longimicrobiaceae bacterium]|nr:hypothetical protein [Longimicrobiaceae bacterium]